MAGAGGSSALERDVLNRGMCTGCGACVGLCPYIAVARDTVAVVEHCRLSEGRCYEFCPRTRLDLPALEHEVFGGAHREPALGSHIHVEMSQACDKGIRERAQYGGSVSALMKYAMDEGVVERCILNRPFAGSLMPRPMVAREGRQVLECAGSNYVASPALAHLNRLTNEGAGRIGMVAIPCQVQALRKMQHAKPESAASRVNLLIGLFCTWALSFRDLNRFLTRMVVTSRIRRMDIPPPPAGVMSVETGTSALDISLDDLRAFVRPACSVCYDLTAEFADISVGMVEGKADWNTLIVRTSAGAELVRGAEGKGIIETRPVDESNLEHLKEASLQKKRRAVAELRKRTGNEEDLLYLELGEQERTLVCQ